MMEYKVKIDQFEGPLDLLLHLIQQLEIDIYDIPVADITDQYVAFVRAMQELELDVASEYLVMAATLIAMKSRSLLPVQEDEEPDEWEEDLRDELARRLIEYKQYKEAAGELSVLEQERQLLYGRPPSDALFQTEEGPVQASVFDLIGAFQKMLNRQKIQSPPEATVRREERSVGERMMEVKQKLIAAGRALLFEELVGNGSRQELVVSFLAILELMKQHEVTIWQDMNFGSLHIAAGGQEHE